jgi:hypothetical protein
MGEDGRAIPGEVSVEKDAGFGLVQQTRHGSDRSRNGRLRRSSPSCSIKSKAWRIAVRADSRRDSSSNRDKPSGPTTTASPSIVKLLALIGSAAAAIRAASRAVGVATVKPHSEIVRADDNSVAVMFDFVDPIGAEGRF